MDTSYAFVVLSFTYKLVTLHWDTRRLCCGVGHERLAITIKPKNNCCKKFLNSIIPRFLYLSFAISSPLPLPLLFVDNMRRRSPVTLALSGRRIALSRARASGATRLPVNITPLGLCASWPTAWWSMAVVGVPQTLQWALFWHSI